MKPKRIIRDVIFLVMFCAGFYLLTQAVGLMGEEAKLKIATSEFSQARRDADYYYERKEFAEAIPHFIKLTEDDPNNSHAWYRLGECYKSVFLQNKKPTMANNLTPYSDANLDKNREYANSAIEAYKTVLDFPRYRSLAKRDIAIVYAQLGERDLALMFLRDAAEEGGFSYREGPRKFEHLSDLFDDPEFLEIEKQFFRRSYYQNQLRTRRRIGVRNPSGNGQSSSKEN